MVEHDFGKLPTLAFVEVRGLYTEILRNGCNGSGPRLEVSRFEQTFLLARESINPWRSPRIHPTRDVGNGHAVLTTLRLCPQHLGCNSLGPKRVPNRPRVDRRLLSNSRNIGLCEGRLNTGAVEVHPAMSITRKPSTPKCSSKASR